MDHPTLFTGHLPAAVPANGWSRERRAAGFGCRRIRRSPRTSRWSRARRRGDRARPFVRSGGRSRALATHIAATATPMLATGDSRRALSDELACESWSATTMAFGAPGLRAARRRRADADARRLDRRARAQMDGGESSAFVRSRPDVDARRRARHTPAPGAPADCVVAAMTLLFGRRTEARPRACRHQRQDQRRRRHRVFGDDGHRARRRRSGAFRRSACRARRRIERPGVADAAAIGSLLRVLWDGRAEWAMAGSLALAQPAGRAAGAARAGARRPRQDRRAPATSFESIGALHHVSHSRAADRVPPPPATRMRCLAAGTIAVVRLCWHMQVRIPDEVLAAWQAGALKWSIEPCIGLLVLGLGSASSTAAEREAHPRASDPLHSVGKAGPKDGPSKERTRQGIAG